MSLTLVQTTIDTQLIKSLIYRTKTAFLEVIITIDKFMNENNMHPAIKSRIMAFYELQWQYNSVNI